MSRRILIIEDNRDLADVVAMNLRDLAATIDVADDGVRGLAMAREQPYDLLILDLMLPGMEGLEICRVLRASEVYQPILMLTARSSETDRVLGLEMGADDYLTKPFSVRELVARVRALFRRIDALSETREGGADTRVVRGDLVIDCARRTVTVDGRPVELTTREFDLLMHFARNPGRVYKRAQLLDHVWGYGYEGYEHTVNTHINRLRAKIEQNPSSPRYIQTVWGVGYKFTDSGA
ncbi:MAG: response regulator transcription factor [Gammaproteobacteria bacterium]|nr:response regulator transcription factor [Gammaproteobacteria bacterium]